MWLTFKGFKPEALTALEESAKTNLNDATAFDPDGLPNHIEGHVAVSVRTAPEGALRFIALEWLRRDAHRSG